MSLGKIPGAFSFLPGISFYFTTADNYHPNIGTIHWIHQNTHSRYRTGEQHYRGIAGETYDNFQPHPAEACFFYTAIEKYNDIAKTILPFLTDFVTHEYAQRDHCCKIYIICLTDKICLNVSNIIRSRPSLCMPDILCLPCCYIPYGIC